MIVTFCGHRDLLNAEELEQRLAAICEELIAEGADTFYLGGYGAFDQLAARVVKAAKDRHPHITFILVLPYLQHNMRTGNYDETLYPALETVPKQFAVLRRNEWMVEHADMVVACVLRDWGGASKTLDCARRKKKRIINC